MVYGFILQFAVEGDGFLIVDNWAHPKFMSTRHRISYLDCCSNKVMDLRKVSCHLIF